MRNQPQILPEPIKILFACAGPDDASCMRLGEEIREIRDWIKKGPFRDHFSIVDIFATRQNDLREALLEHKPHILHFSGHGSQSGIILEDKAGKTSLFEFEQLALLLSAFPDNLRMLVLNACYSGLQAEALCKVVDIVVGMNHKILDTSAIDFSSALYLGLGYNRSILECFISALSSLPVVSIPQAHIPVLLCKEGIDPSRVDPSLWLAPKPPEEEPTTDIIGADTKGTIQIEIMLLSQGTTEVRRWRYTCNEEQELFESLDDPKELLTPESMWARIAAETNKSTNGFRNTGIAPPDVVLMLRDNLILNLYPEKTVENILTQLGRAAVGTSFYVVCDEEVPFNTLYQRKYERVLDRWFQMLIMSGVADLIELPRNRESNANNEPDTLRRCVNKSQERRERLRRLMSTDDWMVELRPEAKLLKRFLQRFAEGDFGPANGKNLAVFYDQKPKFGWSELLKASRQRNCTGKWFIGAHTGAKNISDLKEMWIQESHDKTPEYFDEIFEFQGIFEWLFAICRLHRSVRLARQTSPAIAGKALF